MVSYVSDYNTSFSANNLYSEGNIGVHQEYTEEVDTTTAEERERIDNILQKQRKQATIKQAQNDEERKQFLALPTVPPISLPVDVYERRIIQAVQPPIDYKKSEQIKRESLEQFREVKRQSDENLVASQQKNAQSNARVRRLYIETIATQNRHLDDIRAHRLHLQAEEKKDYAQPRDIHIQGWITESNKVIDGYIAKERAYKENIEKGENYDLHLSNEERNKEKLILEKKQKLEQIRREKVVSQFSLYEFKKKQLFEVVFLFELSNTMISEPI